MTHAEAAALYPHREPFGVLRPTVGTWGKAFADAKKRGEELGLTRRTEPDCPKCGGTGEMNDADTVEHDQRRCVSCLGTGRGESEPECDGIILSGLSDDDPPIPPVGRWLGAVTLYYRPRRAVVAAGGAA